MLKKIISFVLSFSLITSQPVFAQGVAQINLGNYLRTVGSSVAMDKFRPLHMRYFSYDALSDNFQLLLDKGDNKDIKEAELEEKTKVLMEYFKIGLALPNEKFWVNLRPDAQDQIIDPLLEKTDMGKIMLEADLQLKKDTAGLTSPQNPEGKAYWDKLYKKAGELFGSENITIPTITRPWIVPGEIILRQGEGSAYIFKANMKVMLESDYLNSQPSAISSQQYNFKDPRMKELNEYSSQLIRELIIPRLTKEVNTSKRYAALRQVFFSLVMARWFKDTFGSSGSASASGARAPENSYVKLIDSGDLTNLTSKETWSKTYYFNEYKKSFEKGEYNLKEEISTPTGQVIRSYISGGIVSSSIVNNGFEGFKKSLIPIFLSFVSLFSGFSGNSKGELTSVAAAEVINYSALDKLGEVLRKRKDQLKNMPDSPQKQKVLESLEKIKNSLERVETSGVALENEARKTVEDMISEATKGGDLLLQGLNDMNEKLESLLNSAKTKNQKTKDAVKGLNADTAFLKEWNKINRELWDAVEALSVESDGNLGKELAGILESMLKQGNNMKIPETQNPRIGDVLELLKNALSALRANPSKYHPTEEKTVGNVLSILKRNLSGKSSSSVEYKLPYEKAKSLLTTAFANTIMEGVGEPIQQDVELFSLGAEVLEGGYPDDSEAAEDFAGKIAGDMMDYAREVARKYKVYDANIVAGEFFPAVVKSRTENGIMPTPEKIINKVKEVSSTKFKPNKTSSSTLSETEYAAENIEYKAYEKMGAIYWNKEDKEYFVFDIMGKDKTLSLRTFNKQEAMSRARGEVAFMNVIKVLEAMTDDKDLLHRAEFKAYKEMKLAYGDDNMGYYVIKEDTQPGVDPKSFKYRLVGKNMNDAIYAVRETMPVRLYIPCKKELLERVREEISKTASSAVGGIDFRQMNYLVQPMGNFKELQFGLPILTSSALERINLDEELKKLRDMVKNGMLPSGMRVKEYLAACFQKGKIEEKQDDLLVCLAEIYRLAEEENLETSPELRESLVIVDTGKFALLPNNQKAGLN